MFENLELSRALKCIYFVIHVYYLSFFDKKIIFQIYRDSIGKNIVLL
jgi:hypothetical protein